MRLVLVEPDIPHNAGSLMRLAACLDVGLDIVEPCGFLLDDRRLGRVAMDYAARAEVVRHRSWDAFLAAVAAERTASPPGGRLLLLTTRAAETYGEIDFRPGDRLLLGSESAGAPPAVHAAADRRLRIPMAPGLRSLNVSLAAAMVLGEALRQTQGFPAAAPARAAS